MMSLLIYFIQVKTGILIIHNFCASLRLLLFSYVGVQLLIHPALYIHVIHATKLCSVSLSSVSHVSCGTVVFLDNSTITGEFYCSHFS